MKTEIQGIVGDLCGNLEKGLSSKFKRAEDLYGDGHPLRAHHILREILPGVLLVTVLKRFSGSEEKKNEL